MNFRLFRTLDWSLIIVPLFLVAYGVSILYSFSFGGQKNLAIYDGVYALLGIGTMIFLTFLDYRTFRGIAWYLYVLTLILLGLVLVVGSQVFGARRWLDFGFFQLQPSELMKLVLIFVLARLAIAQTDFLWRKIITIGLAAIIPIALILKQPDLGTAVVLLIIAAAFVAHIRPPRLFWPTIVVVCLIAAPTVWSTLRPYQKDRLTSFLNPTHDISGVGYNVTQSKIAIGSGGIWGRGLGQGSQSQLNFLPVAHADFIFAAVAEASGFAGSAALLFLYSLLVWRAINAAILSQDDFGHFVAFGIAVMFVFQMVVNIGMNMGLLPVTGIPLPFVSFGGSGMIVNFAAVGILQSIYIRHKKIRFG